jgi:lipoprotein NlpI
MLSRMSNAARFRLLLVLGLLIASGAVAPAASAPPATGPVPVKLDPQRERALLREIGECDKLLARDAGDAGGYQRRGVAQFRLGRILEAVADFDKYVELRPDDAPHHWQRGIALYYAGRYEDGAKQFELHRTVNPDDVENAAWHYLCVARAATGRGEDAKKAVEKARALLIPIKGDRRVPMMNVHALYAAKGTAEDVLAAANAGKPDPDELKDRLFYAHLYIGLWHEAAGQAAEAKKHIELAAGEYAQDHYMGDVARVHAAVLAKADAPRKR